MTAVPQPQSESDAPARSAPPGTSAPRDRWWRSGWALIAGLALLKLLIHLYANRGYGYFRDELYYFACGEHLDWGYVDQPPMVALAAWLSRKLLGDSLAAVRFLPALAGALKVALTGLIAHELGARRFGMGLACLAAIIAPIYLGTDNFLSMNAFEPVFWMGSACVLVRILKGADPRLWLLFGLLAGLGLENKHSTLFFGFGIFLGLLLTSARRWLASPWTWLGGLVSFLVFLPNLIWEYRHHWATLELLSNIQHSAKNSPVTFWSFLSAQAVMFMLATALWLPGLGWLLFSRDGRPYRALGWAWVVMLATFVILRGKIYYLAPAYPMLLAAGALLLERWAGGPRRNWLKPASVVLFLVTGAVGAPFVLPILPVETYLRYAEFMHFQPPRTESFRLGKLQQQYADMFGWPEMAQVVARAYNQLSPQDKQRCGIFAQNYGQAGAIDFFGAKYGLPRAISGHQNYYLWGPQEYTGECLIVMDDRREVLETEFEYVEQVGMVHHDYAVPYENDKPVFLVRGPKFGTLQDIWPKLKKWR